MSSPAAFRDGSIMDRGEFRQWVETQKGRFERIDGRVIAMAPERGAHLRVKRDVLMALIRAIAAAGVACEPLPDGATVLIDEDGDYEPDAVVTCGEFIPPQSTVAPNPIIVVEVLSPSNKDNDLTRKLVGYFKVPSIRHYLILYADRRQAIHHRRGDHGGIETRFVTGGDILMEPPGIVITIDEIYKSIT